MYYIGIRSETGLSCTVICDIHDGVCIIFFLHMKPTVLKKKEEKIIDAI